MSEPFRSDPETARSQQRYALAAVAVILVSWATILAKLAGLIPDPAFSTQDTHRRPAKLIRTAPGIVAEIPDAPLRRLRVAYTFIDPQGERLMTQSFSRARNFHQGLAAVAVGQRWGFVARDGRWQIEPRYLAAGDFHAGVAPVQVSERQWMYVSSTGAPAFAGRFAYATSFHEQRAAVATRAGWGVIDVGGRWIVPPRYRRISRYSGGLAMAENRAGQRLFLNRRGKVAMAPRSDGIHLAFPTLFHHGVLIGRELRGGARILNRGGQSVGRTPLTPLSHFASGRAVVACQSGGVRRMGFIDVQGRLAIPCVYPDAKPFSQGLAAVYGRTGWGYIDTTGRWRIPPRLSFPPGEFAEGLAAARHPARTTETLQRHEDARVGYLDREGKWRIPPRFAAGGSFVNGSAVVAIHRLLTADHADRP